MGAPHAAVLRPELCVAVMLTLVLGVNARPSSQLAYRRQLRAVPEAIVRREPLAHSRSDLMILRERVESLTSALGEVVKELRGMKSEMAEEIEVIRERGHSVRSIEMKCRTDFTWWHEAVGKTLEYLDNFDVHCRHGEFLRQWRMTWGEQGSRKAIRYVCCHFTHEREHEHDHHVTREREQGQHVAREREQGHHMAREQEHVIEAGAT